MASTWDPDYVNNTDRANFCGYTGYTRKLTATGQLISGTTNVLNISVTDIHDGIYDSVVFLSRFSVVPTFSYSVGAWGACSVSCGSGLVTRSITCTDDFNNASVAASLCSGSKPS